MNRHAFLFGCLTLPFLLGATTEPVNSDDETALLAPVTDATVETAALDAPVPVSRMEPVTINLPDPTRNVLLTSTTEVQSWLEQNQIINARVLRQGRQNLVQFNMSESQWQQREASICGQSGVAACETSVCQGIQASDSGNAKARIMRKAPEVETAEAAGGEGGMCRNVDPIPPLASEAGPGVALDLDLRGLSDNGADSTRAETADTQAVASPEKEVAEAPPEPTTAESAEVSATPEEAFDPYAPAEPTHNAADFALNVLASSADSITLEASNLPADTTGYEVLVGEGCRTTTVPLSSVAPAHIPSLVVAIVSGNASQIGSNYGLSIISESQLTSTGDTIAVYFGVQPIVQTLAALALDPAVSAVSREHVFETTAGPVYSDPMAQFNYGPGQTGALALHPASDGAGQTIAVIDTGVAVDHPDLKDPDQPDRIEALDLTGKGWSSDAHGTAVTGIIAAAADNALGTYGVAPAAKILALKACQPNEENGLAARCWTSTLVKALDAAIARDAQIINMSLAGPPDDLVAKYVALAVSQNRLIIAGAGNGGAEAGAAYPAALPGVLAVTAVDQFNAPYQQANQGEYVDLAAPGVDILTLAPDGTFPLSSGTSWAAAHVSGIAALIRPLMPLSNASDIALVLSSQARDLGTADKDPQFGNGIVDACATAAAASADAITCTPTGEETRHVPR